MRRERLDAGDIIGGAIDRKLVGAEVDADDAGSAAALRQPPGNGRESIAVETEAVDHPLIGIKSKKTRARIARLRLRGHAAGLDETETEPQQGVDHFGVLVKPGRKADRIGKPEAEDLHAQLLVIRRGTWERRQFQRMKRQRV